MKRESLGLSEDDERLRMGRLAGILLLIGSVTAVPAGMTLEPAPPIAEHAPAMIGFAIGLTTYFLPWRRLSSGWIHVLILFGLVEIGIAVAVVSDDFIYFMVLLAIYMAYVARERTLFLAYLALFTLVTLLPFTYADEELREQAHHILIAIPVIIIPAVVVRYLVGVLEERQAQYRRFAMEAVELSGRIRGHELHGESGAEELELILGEMRERREGAATAGSAPRS